MFLCRSKFSFVSEKLLKGRFHVVSVSFWTLNLFLYFSIVLNEIISTIHEIKPGSVAIVQIASEDENFVKAYPPRSGPNALPIDIKAL